jgi:hypothetical protein
VQDVMSNLTRNYSDVLKKTKEKVKRWVQSKMI